MDQTEPGDQNTLGPFGERRKNTIMDSDKHLSDSGIPEATNKMSVFHLRNDTGSRNIDLYQNTCKSTVYQKVNQSKFQRTT